MYETSCVIYIPEPLARGCKTHNSFHNIPYEMTIHFRYYIYIYDCYRVYEYFIDFLLKHYAQIFLKIYFQHNKCGSFHLSQDTACDLIKNLSKIAEQ